MKRPPFATILCPTDLSATGDDAAAIAFALAAPGGVVHLLHVWEPAYVLSPLDAAPMVLLPTSPAADDAHEKKVRAHLRRMVPEGLQGIRHELHVVKDGNPTATIQAEAARLGADVIVLGTHGRTGIGRVLMGSVATDVVKSAKVPVLLVRNGVSK